MKIKESFTDRLFQFVVTAILILLAIAMLIPIINVVAQSFSSKAASDRNIITLWPVEPTLASWQYILSDIALWKSLGLSLWTTLVGTVLALLISSLMAYPLSKSEFKIGRILMMYVIFTMIFKAPMVPYFLTLRTMGLYNNVLVLILPHIMTAYNVAIVRTFFKAFPAEVEDAAKIDGCGYFRTLFQVVLPSSKAVLTTVGLFYAVTMWNQFQHPMMFIQKSEMFPLQMKIRQVLNGGADVGGVTTVADLNYNINTLTAATVIFAMVPIVAIYPVLQKYFEKGAMLGSVKG